MDVILDDRDERPGVKFKDSELIGFPMRIGIGDRSLKEGEVEIKPRKGDLIKIPRGSGSGLCPELARRGFQVKPQFSNLLSPQAFSLKEGRDSQVLDSLRTQE